MDLKFNEIIFLGAGYTSGNLGVYALASGAVTSAWHVCPAAEINFLDYNSDPGKYQVKHSNGTGEVKLLNLRFSKKFWLPNNIARLLFTALFIRTIPIRSFRTKLYNRNTLLRKVYSADFIGSIAGGDSFSDIYGLGRLIYVALPQILVLILGKPLVLMPQTIGPFRTRFGRLLARYILKRAVKIYSRDKEGLKKVSEIIDFNHRGLEFCYDLGFLLEPQIVNEKSPYWLTQIESGNPVVGINISGLMYIGGYTRENMFGLKCDYRNMIHDLIENLIGKFNAHIMLVPHVLGDAESGESDSAACREVLRHIREDFRNHLHIIDDGYDHYEIKALIGKCDFFVGSRMHACIAALSQCIPAVGLAYSRKFHGVFASIGMKGLVIDLREFNQNRIIELIDQIYAQQIEFRKKLQLTMPKVRNRALNFFKGILNDLNTRC